MNHDCEIIQDLMPLVIDGVSSEKSREAVETHVKECAECAAAYEDLKKDLFHQGSPEKQEKKDTERSLKTVLKKKKVSRFLKPFLLGMLIVALAVGSVFGYRYLSDLHVPLSPDQYEICPVQMKNGDILIIMDYKELNGSNQVWGTNIYGDMEETYGPPAASELEEAWMQQMVKDGNAVYIETDGSSSYQFLYTFTDHYYPQRTFGGRKLERRIHNEIRAMLPASRFKNIKGYKIYKGDNQLIWSFGDSVPTASEELEEYYRLYKISRDYGDKMIDHSSPVRAYIVPGEEVRRRDELMKQHLAALETNIPELQPWIGEKADPLDEETFQWAFYGWQ